MGSDTYYGFPKVSDEQRDHIKGYELCSIDKVNKEATDRNKHYLESPVSAYNFCKNSSGDYEIGLNADGTAKTSYVLQLPTYGSHWGWNEDQAVPSRAILYPGHQYVWDLRGCEGRISISGTEKSAGDVFYMTSN